MGYNYDTTQKLGLMVVLLGFYGGFCWDFMVVHMRVSCVHGD